MSRSSPASGLLAVALCGVLVACSAPRTPLATYTLDPRQSPAGVVLVGSLGLSPTSRCIELRALGEPPIALEWPVGYTATFEPLRVYDASGRQVGAEGSQVSMSGELLHLQSPVCQSSSFFRVFTIAEDATPFAT